LIFESTICELTIQIIKFLVFFRQACQQALRKLKQAIIYVILIVKLK